MTMTGTSMAAAAAALRAQPLSLSHTQPVKTRAIQPTASGGNSNLSLKDCLRGNPSGLLASVQGIEVVVFSRRMKMRLLTEQKKELDQQVQKITGSKDSMVDFADFLRLMKWILQTNFSKINEVAEKVVDRERLKFQKQVVGGGLEDQAPPQAAPTENPPSPAARMGFKSYQMQRRKSV
jgi:hypothetical protein